MAGAAQFFATLLERSGHKVAPAAGQPTSIPVAESELFVCGSASEACRSFVAESRLHDVPVFGLPEDVARGDEFYADKLESHATRVIQAIQTSPRVILQIGLPPVTDSRIGRRLVDHLAKLARAVILRARVEHVFVEGGATGASLLRCMGWTRLGVVREICQGVVTFQIAGDRRCLLTLKPGSYAWPRMGP
jgi:uncharacterized protein YgbK (DUF1537 family)